jgi:WD40 repeat protein
VFDLSEQGRLRTWDIRARVHATSVVAARSAALVMTASATANVLAIGRADGSVHLWDIAAGKADVKMRAHQAPVVSLAFSPDGKKLAAIYAVPSWRTVVFDLDVLR